MGLGSAFAVADPHWLHGPNIYVHLWHSTLRAMAGFGSAAVIAIPLGRITVLREFLVPAIPGHLAGPRHCLDPAGYATEKIIVGTIEKRTIERWTVQPG